MINAKEKINCGKRTESISTGVGVVGLCTPGVARRTILRRRHWSADLKEGREVVKGLGKVNQT